MFEVNMFPSKFFIIDDSVTHEELMKVLNTIKKDTENIVSVQSGQNGPTYKTNFSQAAVHGKLFKTIFKQLNTLLASDQVSFELLGNPWYAEYGEYDFHPPHVHSKVGIITETPNSYWYSGVICLSDFGETTFFSPNSSNCDGPIMKLPSKYNRSILFPSNLYHYVTPHGLRDRTRVTLSFNCILKMDL